MCKGIWRIETKCAVSALHRGVELRSRPPLVLPQVGGGPAALGVLWAVMAEAGSGTQACGSYRDVQRDHCNLSMFEMETETQRDDDTGHLSLRAAGGRPGVASSAS